MYVISTRLTYIQGLIFQMNCLPADNSLEISSLVAKKSNETSAVNVRLDSLRPINTLSVIKGQDEPVLS